MVGSLALRAPSRRGRRLGAVLGVVALTAISVQLTTAAPGSADAFEVTPAPSWTNQSFSPDGDHFEDTITGFYCLSSAANIDISVLNGAGQTIKTIGSAGVSRPGDCTSSWTWDGNDALGRPAPDGDYSVVVAGTDLLGATGSFSFLTAIDRQPVASVVAPTANQTVSGSTVAWKVVPDAARVVTQVSGPSDADPPVEQPDHSWIGSFDSTAWLNGTNDLSFRATYADGYDHPHDYPMLRTVTVANALKISAPGWSDHSFTPNAAGTGESVSAGYCLSGAAHVTVKVRHKGGATVRTLEPGADLPAADAACYYNRSGEWIWDGRADGGALVPDGAYEVVVTATPAGGSAVSKVFQTAVDTRVIGTVTAPIDGQVISGGAVDVAFTPSAYADLHVTRVYVQSGQGDLVEQPNGTWTGTFDTAGLVNGPYAMTFVVSFTDSFGFTRQVNVDRNVVIGNAFTIVAPTWFDHSFAPKADGTGETLSAAYCLSADAHVAVAVRHKGGAVVRTLESGADQVATPDSCYPATSGSWSWDGTADGGALVPDGPYEVVVTATPTGGSAVAKVFQTAVDTRVLATVTSPTAGEHVGGAAVPIVVTPGTYADLHVTRVQNSGGQPDLQEQPDGTWTGTFDTAGLPNGTYTLSFWTNFTDSFGFGQDRLVTQDVVIDNDLAVTAASGWRARSFSPNGDDAEPTVDSAYCVSADSHVTVTVRHKGGATVRTLDAGSDALAAAPSCANQTSGSWSWDGKDDADAVVPDGPYQVVVTAAAPGGAPHTLAFETAVDTGDVGHVTEPLPDALVAGLIRLAVQPATGRVVTHVDFCFSGPTRGACITGYNASADGQWRTSVFASDLEEGPNDLRVYESFTDSFGYEHNIQILPVLQVTVDNSSIPLRVTATPTSGPAPLLTSLKIETSDPDRLPLTYTIVWGDGTTNTTGTSASPYADIVKTHTYLAAGSFQPTVTVEDGSHPSSTDHADVAVTARSSSTGFTCDHNPSVFGQPVACTAHVTPATGSVVPTGDVEFTIDGVSSGSPVHLDAAGSAVLSLPVLSVGDHTITAGYHGDALYEDTSATPTSVTQTVAKAATSTVVTSSQASAPVGQAVTFTATVSPTAPGAGTVGGTVRFLADSAEVGSGTIATGGKATFTTSTLSAGSHQVTAEYLGASGFAPSTSSAITQTITAISVATVTTIGCTPAPSVVGQSVTCTATVTGTGSPTGSVQFGVDGAASGAAVALSAGKATFNPAGLAVGSHSVSAAYQPTNGSAFLSSNGSTTQTVNRAATTTALSCLPGPSTFGQSVTCTATVAAVAPGAGTPGGSVLFAIDGVDQPPAATLTASATAALSRSDLTVGSHTITATYAGETRFTGSARSTTQVVNSAASTTTVACSPTPTVFSQPVTCTASVTGPGAAGTPTGSVRFAIDGVDQVPTVSLGAGAKASITRSNLAVGTHTISATYLADAPLSGSSGSTSQVVGQASTVSSVGCSPNPAVVGAAVTCTLSVGAVAPATGVPTGNAKILVDGAGAPSALDGAGKVAFTTSSLALGTHTVTGSYVGTSDYATSQAGPVNLVITSTPVVATTTAVACAPNPAVRGQQVVCLATVTADSGTAQGTVAFEVDNVAVSGPPAAVAGGKATYVSTDLAVGTHPVAATFTSASNASFGTSRGTTDETIAKASTTTVLTCDPSPSVPGQSVTCQAAVTAKAPGGGIPTGNIVFRVDGAVVPGSFPLDAQGRASLTSSSWATGSHTLSASYSGSLDHLASVDTIAHRVDKGQSSVDVTCTPNPTDLTRPVNCTATVAAALPAVGAPTGAVQFALDGKDNGAPATIDGSGQARISLGLLSAGSHTVTGTYGGDGSFTGHAGQTTVAVSGTAQENTTTNLSCTPPSATVGQTVICTVGVSSAAGHPTPTGAVQLSIDGVNVGTPAPLDAAGRHSFPFPDKVPGTYRVKVTYLPTTGSAFVTSNQAVNQTIVKASTTTSLSCTPTSLAVGATSTCAATVRTSATGTIQPTGTIRLSVDGTSGPTATLSTGGTATFEYKPTVAAGHDLIASFDGDQSFTGSKSTAVHLDVTKKLGPDLVVTVTSPAQALVGNTIDVGLRVTNKGTATSPSGSLTVNLDSKLALAKVALPAGCTRSGQAVTCSLGSMRVGGSATFALHAVGKVVGGGCDVVGTAGDDSGLQAPARGGTVCGLGGSDTISGSSAADTIWGDTPPGVSGFTATISASVKSSVAELLTTNNTGSDKTIFGLGAGGTDLMVGGGGGDEIHAGIGDDVAYGGNGNDVVNGDAGADKLMGDAGGDTLDGGDGGDQLLGGAGADSMSGGGGGDLMAGDADTVAEAGQHSLAGAGDTMNGNDGDDLLIGQGGGDTLEGGGGVDRVHGGPGNDRVDGGAGAKGNILYGGDGDDTCSLGPLTGSQYAGTDRGDLRDPTCEHPSRGLTPSPAGSFSWAF